MLTKDVSALQHRPKTSQRSLTSPHSIRHHRHHTTTIIMDEKHHLPPHLPLYRQSNLADRAKRRRRHVLLLLVSTVCTIIFVWHLNSKGSANVLTPNRSPTMSFVPSATDSRKRVPLEAHIMSKCPDSRDCLHDLLLPVMQRVADKVDFKLSYIGR